MTDAHLRDLERRWRETGALDDETRFVAELLRAGATTEDRLRLAAHLGDAASSLAHGVGMPGSMPVLPRWIRDLARRGREPLVRAALASARLTLPLFARFHPGEDAAERLCRAASEWVLEPTAARLQRCADLVASVVKDGRVGGHSAGATFAAMRTLDAPEEGVLGDGLGLDAARRFAAELLQMCGADAEVLPGDLAADQPQRVIVRGMPTRPLFYQVVRRHTGKSVADVKRLALRQTAVEFAVEAVNEAARVCSPDEVRAAIQADLIPWARGERDPVRERVEARGQV